MARQDGLFKQKFKRNDGRRGESANWYGHYKDHTGKRVRVALSTDRQVARSMLADLEKRAERRRTGYHDEHVETRKAPLDGLVDEYLAHLALKGDGPRHVADTKRLISTAFKACGFETVADLRGDVLDTYLARMRRKRSARTVNTYRQAAHGFGVWLRKSKRAVATNPFEDATKAVGEAKVKRRALPMAELEKLLAVALVRPLHDRMTIRNGKRKGEVVARLRPEVRERLERRGRERVLLYKMAIYTGLRRGELRELKVCHLTLGKKPSLSLPGEFTKNGLDANLPLRADTALELQAWIRETGRGPHDRVFNVGKNVYEYLKRDMEAAGIPEFDARGRKFDFHSFRKCTATYLNTSGVPITTAKELLRHSTIELTAGVYNDEDQHDYVQAVASMPSL